MLLDDGEHGGESREKQDAPPFLDQRRQKLPGQEIELSGFLDLLRGGRFQKFRMAADLAQLEQGVEDDDVGFRQAFLADRLTHPLVHRRAHRFVKIRLLAV